jgi:hypothetical protein
MKKKTYNIKNVDGDYVNTSYDEMKNLLSISRLLKEQEEGEMDTALLNREEKPKEEKTKEYTVSGGKIIVHGNNEMELELTDEEKSTYQETMDEFVEQVSDMAEFHPLNIYTTNVEWSGDLLQFDMRFYYSIADVDGVYIGNTNMIKINPEVLELLNKLKSYFTVFSAKWAKLLATRRTTDTEQESELGSAPAISAEDEMA